MTDDALARPRLDLEPEPQLTLATTPALAPVPVPELAPVPPPQRDTEPPTDEAPTDEVLWDDEGYWQHWWNMLHDSDTGDAVPLRMDIIVDAKFGARPWLTELDPMIVEHVIELGLVSGRVIVPPSTLESAAEGLIEYGLRIGFEVRVVADVSPYVLYNGCAVVLSERDDEGRESHHLIRRPSVVAPLQNHFDIRWASAIPWNDYRNGTAGVLHLLALGWTDPQIADALRISGRTVSRRVANAMEAAGARSRFELGMKYAYSEFRTARD